MSILNNQPPANTSINRRLCIAPMLDWTDRHCRYFHRLMTKHTVLYTEMVTTGALIHADPDRFLQYNDAEHPLALQLGGSDPVALAQCARMAEDYGYDEVNLNVGCPSDRVQNGRFGACLMADPALVAECVDKMQQQVKIPVTVKHRIGIDDQDSYEFLHNFVSTVADSGCKTFIIHARKAILSGLSPKQNREIPPLIYDRAYQVKKDFPELEIIINGGIRDFDQSQEHLTEVDGVMIGREAYQNPYLLAQADQKIYGEQTPVLSRGQVMEGIFDYTEAQLSQGAQLGWIARHILCLYQGIPGAKRFRRYISENAFKTGAGVEVLKAAAALVDDTITDAA
ncbi:MAG: tRNA dihydrouridine(20/20a) synthase DusA [Motiliproteus sp.]|nr:tRNA dihydrouridine(20/20a) synthase DusA [Motiliproteus sp.]MCW9051941.1 tRNA dihydrouridine(20/20a) synthase DusA [Motiliproteus sp.]